MALSAQTTSCTADEYLIWEATQAERHHYVNGEVFSMAGAEDRHVTVCLNLALALRQHLQGSACRTYMADMKVHLRAANSYFYPDLLVTCSPKDAQDRLIKREPSLVIEVLSPSTAAYDRGAKFTAYRQLPSLQEYALIDIDTRSSDVYRKGADGLWVLHPFGPGESVQFASVDLTVTAASLFAEVDEDSAV
jgi:Uma2 family endonuclease